MGNKFGISAAVALLTLAISMAVMGALSEPSEPRATAQAPTKIPTIPTVPTTVPTPVLAPVNDSDVESCQAPGRAALLGAFNTTGEVDATPTLQAAKQLDAPLPVINN